MKKLPSILFLLFFLGNCFSLTLDNDGKIKEPVLLQNFENKGYLIANSNGHLLTHYLNKNSSMEKTDLFNGDVLLLSDFYRYSYFDSFGVCFIGKKSEQKALFILAVNSSIKGIFSKMIPLNNNFSYEIKDIDSDKSNLLNILLTADGCVEGIKIDLLENTFLINEYAGGIVFENTEIFLKDDFIYGIGKTNGGLFAICAKEKNYNILKLDDIFNFSNSVSNKLQNEFVLFTTECMEKLHFSRDLEIYNEKTDISFIEITDIKDLLVEGNYLCIINEEKNDLTAIVCDLSSGYKDVIHLNQNEDVINCFINKDSNFASSQIMLIKYISSDEAELIVYAFDSNKNIQKINECRFNTFNMNLCSNLQLFNKYNNITGKRQTFISDKNGANISIFEKPNIYLDEIINSNSINNNLYVLTVQNSKISIEYAGK